MSKIIDIIHFLSEKNENYLEKGCLIAPLVNLGKIRDIVNHPIKDPAPESHGRGGFLGRLTRRPVNS